MPSMVKRTRANWYAWLKRMAFESTRLSTVTDDSRAMKPSVLTGKPGG